MINQSFDGRKGKKNVEGELSSEEENLRRWEVGEYIEVEKIDAII
jgi:hypothetical protein